MICFAGFLSLIYGLLYGFFFAYPIVFAKGHGFNAGRSVQGSAEAIAELISLPLGQDKPVLPSSASSLASASVAFSCVQSKRSTTSARSSRAEERPRPSHVSCSNSFLRPHSHTDISLAQDYL